MPPLNPKPRKATPAAPPPGPADSAWQLAHDAVQAAFDQANDAFNRTRDPEQRSTLSDLADVLSDQITALDREDMQKRTVSLQAATGQLNDGIKKLKALQLELKGIAQNFAIAAEVIDGVDGAISGLKSFLAVLA